MFIEAIISGEGFVFVFSLGDDGGGVFQGVVIIGVVVGGVGGFGGII